jgi:hypothetical protein
LQIIGVDLPGGDSVGSAIMKATRVPFSHPFAFLSHPRLLLALGLLALSGAPIISAASAESLPRAIAKTFTEHAKLIPPLNDSYTKFGNAVSLSGNRALIGAYLGGDQVGHAYIFVFDGTTWTLEADLAPSDGTAGDLFGYRVSLSGDRALVGAEGHGDSGAAYVFAFDGRAWTQQAKLAPSIRGVAFGASVSLSGDLALVGDPNINDATGAAYIYSFNGATWKQQAKLISSDAAENDYFGSSVSLSDGRAAVGASKYLSSRTGAVYVFTKNGAAWTQEAELAASDGVANDGFGFNVALSGDRVLAGAQFANTNFVQAGAAYVFAFDGATWNQQAKLIAPESTAYDVFGYSVSLLGDHALVGAIGGNDNNAGAAYVFTFDGTTWAPQAKLIASDGAAFDFFGSAVSLSTNRILVGAPDNLGNGNGSGAAYIFERNRQQP